MLLMAGACFAQLPFSIGVKAGVPITDSFSSNPSAALSSFSSSKNYIVGPMVELKLPFHLSVEADALYRPYNATGTASSLPGILTFNNNYSVWEFPVLAKYRFQFPVVKPYIEAGPSFRTSPSSISFISNNGFTIGGGVDVHALVIHISPEARYTHWGSDSVNQALFQSNQNQAEFLVGFSF